MEEALRQRRPEGTNLAGNLDFGLLAFRTVESIHFYWFQLLSLWSFVTAVLENEYAYYGPTSNNSNSVARSPLLMFVKCPPPV